MSHTYTLKTNKRKLHSASSNSLPAPLHWACAHHGADGGESARFLLLCLRATKGIKGLFLFLKCSPLALNTLGFSESRSEVSGPLPLVFFPPCLQLHCPHSSAERTMPHFSAARVTASEIFQKKKNVSLPPREDKGLWEITPPHTFTPTNTSSFQSDFSRNFPPFPHEPSQQQRLHRFLTEKINKFRSGQFSSCLLARLTAS